jgi:hypothetical protein
MYLVLFVINESPTTSTPWFLKLIGPGAIIATVVTIWNSYDNILDWFNQRQSDKKSREHKNFTDDNFE